MLPPFYYYTTSNYNVSNKIIVKCKKCRAFTKNERIYIFADKLFFRQTIDIKIEFFNKFFILVINVVKHKNF